MFKPKIKRKNNQRLPAKEHLPSSHPDTTKAKDSKSQDSKGKESPKFSQDKKSEGRAEQTKNKKPISQEKAQPAEIFTPSEATKKEDQQISFDVPIENTHSQTQTHVEEPPHITNDFPVQTHYPVQNPSFAPPLQQRPFQVPYGAPHSQFIPPPPPTNWMQPNFQHRAPGYYQYAPPFIQNASPQFPYGPPFPFPYGSPPIPYGANPFAPYRGPDNMQGWAHPVPMPPQYQYPIEQAPYQPPVSQTAPRPIELLPEMHLDSTSMTFLGEEPSSLEDGINRIELQKEEKNLEDNSPSKDFISNLTKEEDEKCIDSSDAAKTEEMNCTFHGRYAKEYDEFFSYFKSVKKDLDDNYESLGNVASSPEYFFQETNDCKEFAENFLHGYWEKSMHINSTLENHADKCQHTNSKSEQFPTCISFVDTIIDGKKCFLIALSGEPSNHAHKDLKRYINEHNLKNPNGPEWILLGNEQRNFSKMVNTVEKSEASPPCAENTIFSFLLKAMLEKGSNIYVNGVINCDFYPYQRNLRYGSQTGSSTKNVRPPIYVSGGIDLRYQAKEVQRNDFLSIRVPVKPCCTTCQKRKKTMLAILKSGERYLNENANKIVERRLQTSPISYSIKSDCSLFKQKNRVPNPRQSSTPGSAYPPKKFGFKKTDTNY